MKNIITSALILAVGSFAFTSCMEETFPTSGLTEDQLTASSKALNSLANGMPSYMITNDVWDKGQTDFGYPSRMIIRNLQTQDCLQNYNGYQHFYWAQNATVAMNDQYLLCQSQWYYYNFQVQACNNLIGQIDENTEEPVLQNLLAQGLAYRASTYLDMARTYEFLPNETVTPINSDGNDVTGLTVPVCTPGMTEEEKANNPRLTHDQMRDFLIADLTKAEMLFQSSRVARSSKLLPDLGVVYGLMARVYMWDEDYPKAAEYARKAINTSGAQPLTQAEFTDQLKGFNSLSPSAWMWGLKQESNNDVVQSAACWGAFMIPECNIGYSGQLHCSISIDRMLYQQISNDDWRKLLFKAPAGSALSGKEIFLSEDKGETLADYVGFKFRPGLGDMDNRQNAFSTAIPLMRVEEMYLIEAEATAHTSPTQGKSLLENFVRTYRYQSYACTANDKEGIIDECFLQKRIELWGEGQVFFDYKRLNKSVTRQYDGTNWPATSRFNTAGRPCWLNWPIVQSEAQYNMGVKGWLNPNTGDLFKDAK